MAEEIKNDIKSNSMYVRGYDPKTTTHKNENYIIVPSVLIVEGVLNHIMYTADEMYKSSYLWDGKPVTINHPKGKAGLPEVLESAGVGFLTNTTFSDEDGKAKLKSELWLNEKDLERVSPDVYKRIKNGEVIEVSTGLFTHDVYVPNSTFNGKYFDSVAVDYVPDHLAILPTAIGACSIQDGCGIRENESEETDMGLYQKVMDFVKSIRKHNEKQDHDNTQTAEDISHNDKEETKENSIMTKQKCCPEVVDALIASGKYNEDDREGLYALTSDTLKSLLSSIKANDGATPAEAENAPKDEAKVNDEVPAEAEKPTEVAKPAEAEVAKPVPAEDVKASDILIEKLTTKNEEKVVLNSVDDFAKVDVASEFMLQINEALKMYNNRKDEAIATILNAPKSKFNRELLANKSMVELEAIESLVNDRVDYSLAGVESTPAVRKNTNEGIGFGKQAIGQVITVQGSNKNVPTLF